MIDSSINTGFWFMPEACLSPSSKEIMISVSLPHRYLGSFLLIGLLLSSAACDSPQVQRATSEPAMNPHLIQALDHAEKAEAAGGDVLNVAFLAVETVYNSELMAPYDVIQHTIFRDESHYMLPFIVSPDGEPITTFEGIEIRPHYSFETAPEIDILIIPSSGNSMTADLENEALISWIAKIADKAQYVITVCDGAFPLAATGVLDGRIATTFPADRDAFAEMFPEVDVRYDANFVVDSKFITSVGGAMSYEPAFFLVEHLYSKESAARIGEGLVWDWRLEDVPHLIVSSNQ